MANLIWSQANPFAISLDSALQTWNAGHVNDILAMGDSIVVASDTGGVWLINPPFAAFPQTDAYPATCLSDDWLEANVSCLAFGPDDQMQVYAACWGPPAGVAPALYALTFRAKNGGVELVGRTKIALPWNNGSKGLNKVVVQQNPRRIVIATDQGILWSAIPAPFDQAAGYAWGLASGIPDGGYSGLALGPGSTVVAAAWGANAASGLYGIFVGDWVRQSTGLEFRRATIKRSSLRQRIGTSGGSGAGPGRSNMRVPPDTQMLRTSVASCAGNRNILYAVSAGPNDSIFGVLKSQDGGNTWVPVHSPPDPGIQGSYNNCIHVSPSDPAVVAIGWQRGGPFISKDGGTSWNLIGGDGLHDDLHAVYFPGFPSDSGALFVGSDGGIALLSGDGSVNSKYNMHLLNLQCYPGGGSASSQYAGLYGVGTQDNGNLFCVVDPTAAPIYRPWTRLEYADGGLNRFLSTGHVLHNNKAGGDPRVRVDKVDKWDSNARKFSGENMVILVDGTADGLPSPVLEIVNLPQYSRNNQIMYAIGGGTTTAYVIGLDPKPIPTATNQNIYGLFADQGGANMHWTFIANVGENITSLASATGNKIIVGTDQGHIFTCDSSSGKLTPMALSATVKGLHGGGIYSLRVFDDSLMYAIHTDGYVGGYVLWYNTGVWDILPGLLWQQYIGLEADWTASPKVLYVASSITVFSTNNNGQSWTNDSHGLPAAPQCRDLRLAVLPDGSRYLYLGTYGRSVWRATIVEHGTPRLPVNRRLPNNLAQGVRILFGVIGCGGGWTTGGPVPPQGPDRAIFAGLLTAALAETLPGNLGKASRTEALQLVALRARELARGEVGKSGGMGEAKEALSEPAGKVSDLGRIIEIVSHFQGKAHPEHELVAGMLAAALASKHPGAEGKKALAEALAFIAQRAEEMISSAAVK